MRIKQEMKRLILALAACVLLGLAACGDATAERETDSTYKKGTITETGFESEWLNLRMVAPSDVTMATQEEMDVLTGVGMEVIYADQSEYMLSLAELNLVYEMMANHSSGASVIVEVELLAKSNQNMTAEQYLEILVKTSEAADFGYSSDGVLHTRTLVGEEYAGIYATITAENGITVCQEILVRKKENRMIVIGLSYPESQEESGDYLLSLLEPYDSSNPLPTGVPVTDTYEKGILTEYGFESRWMGVSFRTPESMAMATQEEMDAVMMQGAELIYGDNASAYLDYTNLQAVYEIQADGADGIPSVQVIVEKPIYKNMTAEMYAATVKESIKNTVEAYGAVCTVHGNLADVEIVGTEYKNLIMDVTYANGITLCQNYYIREKEGRIISITITYLEGMEHDLQMILDAFSPYGSNENLQEPETLTLEALQSEALVGGNLCAAAYLGYMEEGYPEFMTFLEDSGLLAQFPFLSEIKEENTVLASGGEWYVLVPMEKGLTLTVSEAVLDETTYALVAGRELLQTEAGQPLLLRGNVSDIFPSFIVTMSGPDGTELDYAPGLSLRDGALLQKEGVYDFTVYAEGQLEED